MTRTSRTLTSLALLGALAACGSRALDVPESLVIVDYPANAALTLTFVMKTCSDTCSTYEAPVCTVETDTAEGNVVTVDVSVPYGDKADTDAATLEGCSLSCGPPVLAHCSVPALAAGEWSVEAGAFQTTIRVR